MKVSKKELKVVNLVMFIIIVASFVSSAFLLFYFKEAMLARYTLFVYISSSILFTCFFKKGYGVIINIISVLAVIFFIMMTNVTVSPKVVFNVNPQPLINVEPNFFNGSVPLACSLYVNDAISCIPLEMIQNETYHDYFTIPCSQNVTDTGVCSYNPTQRLLNCDFTIFKSAPNINGG